LWVQRSLIPCLCITPLTCSLSSMVSNEFSDFRSQMKDIAREVVKFQYKDVFPTDFKGHEVVKQNVIRILSEGRFLRSGVDENGKTKNLAHPSIEALALQFYYTGDAGLANLFPGDFKDTIPDPAFALLMTCIQNCLEEYSELGLRTGINFEGKKCREIYEKYLDVINDCKKNEYHGPRFESCRAEWASKGM